MLKTSPIANKARLKLTAVFAAGALVFFGYAGTQAGEYHAQKEKTYSQTTETLICSQCHTIHGSQGGQSMIYGGAATVYRALLRAPTIVQLCRTCHEANSLGMGSGPYSGLPTPPDIWNNTQSYTPSAGDFAHNNTVNEANRHSIDQSALSPPGSNPSFQIYYFSCESCHDQHGNNNYRNLKKRPGNMTSDINVSYVLDGNGTSDACSDGTVGTACDVNLDTVNNALPQANLTKFQRGNVRFNKTATSTSGIARWCGGCHTDFHGSPGDSNMGGAPGNGDDNTGSPWLRHPVRDVSIDRANTNLHADKSNWVNNVTAGIRIRAVNPDNAEPNITTADEQPFCLTCHYAHGGGNPDTVADTAYNHTNLVKLDNSGNLNISASYNDNNGGFLRNVCEQCHNQ